MLRIVTDSTCDLPTELVRQHRITVVPVNIQFGRETYQEGVNIQGKAFYRMVDELKQLPTTSQPSLGQFQAAYRSLAAEPDTTGILSLHITGQLSGTFDAAVVAARQMPQPPPITVFDSWSGSMGLGFMVLEAAQMAEAGKAMPEILARLEVLRQRMRIFFSLEDLRYARMSGRVGFARLLLVSALNIKLLLTVQQGKLALFSRVRSRPRALAAMIDALADTLGSQKPRLAVIHAQAAEVAGQVRNMLQARFPGSEILLRDLSLGIAVHFGPGTVGVIGYVP